MHHQQPLPSRTWDVLLLLSSIFSLRSTQGSGVHTPNLDSCGCRMVMLMAGCCLCRGLALLVGHRVVSASHDLTLKVWDFEGSLRAELIGHTAIVYSVAALGSSLVASASEDSSARIWTPDGECLAHIPHPGTLTQPQQPSPNPPQNHHTLLKRVGTGRWSSTLEACWPDKDAEGSNGLQAVCGQLLSAAMVTL